MKVQSDVSGMEVRRFLPSPRVQMPRPKLYGENLGRVRAFLRVID